MKKGFLHIVEILIITLVMFAVMLQFATIPGTPSDFEKARLELIGNDILFTLDEKGVNWLDNGTKQDIDALLAGTNLVYSLDAKAIKTPVYVGCVCTDEELEYTKEVLQPYRLNGELVEFSVFKIEPPESTNQFFNRPTLPLYYDVILIYDYPMAKKEGFFSYNYFNETENFLASGNGIVQVRDLDAAELTGDNLVVYRYLFGLKPDPAASPGSQPVKFTGSSAIGKYFHNVPFFYSDLSEYSDKFFYSGSSPGWDNSGGVTNAFGYSNTMMYQEPVPANHKAKFNFSVSNPNSKPVGVYWCPGFQNEGNFVAAGYWNQMLVIGNQSVMDGSFLATKSFPIGWESNYWLEVEKNGKTVKARIWNSTHYEELEHTFSSIPLQEQGIFVNHSDTSGFLSVHLTDLRMSIPFEYSFDNFLGSQEKIRVAEGFEESSAILRETGNGVPALIANQRFTLNVSGVKPRFLPGKIAWLSDLPEPERSALIRALVTWAAPEGYEIIKSVVPDPVSIPFFKTVNEDMFQPIELSLKLGFVFK